MFEIVFYGWKIELFYERNGFPYGAWLRVSINSSFNCKGAVNGEMNENRASESVMVGKTATARGNCKLVAMVSLAKVPVEESLVVGDYKR